MAAVPRASSPNSLECFCGRESSVARFSLQYVRLSMSAGVQFGGGHTECAGPICFNKIHSPYAVTRLNISGGKIISELGYLVLLMDPSPTSRGTCLPAAPLPDPDQDSADEDSFADDAGSEEMAKARERKKALQDFPREAYIIHNMAVVGPFQAALPSNLTLVVGCRNAHCHGGEDPARVPTCQADDSHHSREHPS